MESYLCICHILSVSVSILSSLPFCIRIHLSVHLAASFIIKYSQSSARKAIGTLVDSAVAQSQAAVGEYRVASHSLSSLLLFIQTTMFSPRAVTKASCSRASSSVLPSCSASIATSGKQLLQRQRRLFSITIQRQASNNNGNTYYVATLPWADKDQDRKERFNELIKNSSFTDNENIGEEEPSGGGPHL